MTFKPWNRREFIAKPLTWVAASQLLGHAGLLHAAVFGEPQPPVLTRTLGRTGLAVPIVSMGVMNANMPAVVRRAYEVGIRHFDTAAGYQAGRNEEMLGAVIKELGVRNNVVIATKAHVPAARRREPTARQEFLNIFEGSLKRLQMDHVDILYYHNVDNADDAALEGPLEALTSLKKQGRTRFIGISTHSHQPDVLNAATKLGVYDVALVSYNYVMSGNKDLQQAIENAAAKGIGLVAMKTQAGGLAKPSKELGTNLPEHSQTALLKWVLQNKHIATAIPGFTNFDQLEQNFTVARGIAYAPAEQQFLSDKKQLAQAEFCVQCGECRAGCPLGANIPEMMRSHMYAVQYANGEHAARTLAAIAPGKGLDACSGCGTCKAQCRNSVNIARKLTELKQLAPTLLA